MALEPRNLYDVLAGVSGHWSPRTIAIVNDYDARVGKVYEGDVALVRGRQVSRLSAVSSLGVSACVDGPPALRRYETRARNTDGGPRMPALGTSRASLRQLHTRGLPAVKAVSQVWPAQRLARCGPDLVSVLVRFGHYRHSSAASSGRVRAGS